MNNMTPLPPPDGDDWWGYWEDHVDTKIDNGSVENVWMDALDRWFKGAMYVLAGLAVICICCLCGGWLVS